MLKYFSVLLLITLVFVGCKDTTNDAPNVGGVDAKYTNITGEAQGTTYSVSYADNENQDFTKQIDSILKAYDLELSSYNAESVLSIINSSSEHVIDLNELGNYINFEECYNLSKEVYYRTNGSFNPAVQPLVSYWGFYTDQPKTDAKIGEVDSLLQIIDFSESFFALKGGTLSKQLSNAKIDFNGIAQGHSVDVVSMFLEAKGIENYMVEIGGEVRCHGINDKGTRWKIGIDQPIENSKPGENEFQFIAGLENLSLATSGSYRKFYEVDGKKYSHTINPVTGYPVAHNLLSVTVIAKNCANADAYATAFMVMGLLNSIDFINNNPDLELNAYFVFDSSEGIQNTMTKGFEKFIEK